ncbi:hypothetical protein QUB15_28115, partial [Microcoleus sp. B3-C5]
PIFFYHKLAQSLLNMGLGRVVTPPAHKEENLGRLAAESTLRQLVTQLLNSGMSLEQIAQMMNLSTVEVRRLVGENF